jgi:hypothetical protein
MFGSDGPSLRNVDGGVVVEGDVVGAYCVAGAGAGVGAGLAGVKRVDGTYVFAGWFVMLG